MLRGYDRIVVDQLLAEATQALESGDPQLRAQAKAKIAQANPLVVLRGYDRGQIDAHLARLSTLL